MLYRMLHFTLERWPTAVPIYAFLRIIIESPSYCYCKIAIHAMLITDENQNARDEYQRYKQLWKKISFSVLRLFISRRTYHMVLCTIILTTGNAARNSKKMGKYTAANRAANDRRKEKCGDLRQLFAWFICSISIDLLDDMCDEQTVLSNLQTFDEKGRQARWERVSG